MLPLFNTHLEALICFNRISTVGLCTKSVGFFLQFIALANTHTHTRNKRTQTHRNGKIGDTQLHSYTDHEKATSVFPRELHTGHFIRYTLPVQGT